MNMQSLRDWIDGPGKQFVQTIYGTFDKVG